MTSSLYLNVIVAYVQYMYVFVSYQYVDSSSNFDVEMVLWLLQMNRSLCMSKYIWHYVSELQMLGYVCNVVYRVTAKAHLSYMKLVNEMQKLC